MANKVKIIPTCLDCGAAIGRRAKRCVGCVNKFVNKEKWRRK